MFWIANIPSLFLRDWKIIVVSFAAACEASANPNDAAPEIQCQDHEKDLMRHAHEAQSLAGGHRESKVAVDRESEVLDEGKQVCIGDKEAESVNKGLIIWNELRGTPVVRVSAIRHHPSQLSCDLE